MNAAPVVLDSNEEPNNRALLCALTHPAPRFQSHLTLPASQMASLDTMRATSGPSTRLQRLPPFFLM